MVTINRAKDILNFWFVNKIAANRIVEFFLYQKVHYPFLLEDTFL